MATIVEIQNEKIEHLSDYAEKVMKYGKKLMECIEEIDSRGSYSERYGSRKYGMRRSHYEDEEYSRYY